MKKGLKALALGILATTITMSTVYSFAGEADEDFGSAGVAQGESYRVEEILKYAIEDEYMARAEYEAIIKELGVERPFVNILRAEETHISLLVPLLEKYNVPIPKDVASTKVTIPETLEEAFSVGIEAEKNNISMYNQFLKEDLPEDVAYVLERLMLGSENHLAAFERGELRGNQPLGNGGMFKNRNYSNQESQERGFGAMSRGSFNGSNPICIVE